MALWNMIRNEVREMLSIKILLPVVLVSLLFSAFGDMIGGIESEVEKQPTIGVVVHDKGVLGQIAEGLLERQTKVIYNGTDEEQGLDAVISKKGAALVIVDENFTSDIMANRSGTVRIVWVMQGAGVLDSIPSGTVTAAIDTVSATLSSILIDRNNTISPDVVLAPIVRNETTMFRDRSIEGVSPGRISSLISSQAMTVPIITTIIIMMAGGSVISSMGQEKENKTLETLLTMPVSRTTIVAGKIAGNAIIGLVMALIYMAGFSRYMSSFSSSNSEMEEMGLSLSVTDYILVGMSLFLALFAGLAICMILGTFAKNYKSAQFLLFPVSMLTLIPMFILMFQDFDTLSIWLKGLVFIIPFSHPMMSVRLLMFDQYGLFIAGLGYLLLLSGALIAIAVRIFKSDRLVTGSPPGWWTRITGILKDRRPKVI